MKENFENVKQMKKVCEFFLWIKKVLSFSKVHTYYPQL